MSLSIIGNLEESGSRGISVWTPGRICSIPHLNVRRYPHQLLELEHLHDKNEWYRYFGIYL